MEKRELLKRFQSPDDKLLFSKVLDRLFLCQSKCEKTFTFFMDPIHALKFTEVIHANADEKILAYGGASCCERKMLGFAPSFQEWAPTDFPIDRLSIRFMKKFGASLTHRDFLGSITGLGISREKIGDINIEEGEAAAFVNRDVSGFICAGLERVGRVRVTVKPEQVESAFWEGWQELKPDDGREMLINTSSLRLDAVIGAVFNIARGDAAKLIRGEKVSISWTSVSQNEKGVTQGDILTIRGYGRARIETIERSARKERYVIRLYKYS